MALDRYAPDEEWLLAKKGFWIADAHAVAGGLSRLQARKLQEARDALKGLEPDQWTMLPGFTFTLDEIVAEAKIAVSTAVAVLSALSVAAPTNADFTSLGAFNIANACPILRTSVGDYVSLQTYGVVESLYDSPFYWMAADNAYKDVLNGRRDRLDTVDMDALSGKIRWQLGHGLAAILDQNMQRIAEYGGIKHEGMSGQQFQRLRQRLEGSSQAAKVSAQSSSGCF